MRKNTLSLLWDRCNLLRWCIDTCYTDRKPPTLTDRQKNVRDLLASCSYFGSLLIFTPWALWSWTSLTAVGLSYYYGVVSLFLTISLSSFESIIRLRRYISVIPFLLLSNSSERRILFQKRPTKGWGVFKTRSAFSIWPHFGAEKEALVEARWLHGEDGDRDMVLLNTMQFVDNRGYVWIAKPGLRIDGASTPKIFWNTIGPPYVGCYRKASVVHDAYCEDHPQSGLQGWWAKKHGKSSEEVHRMFFEAMRADREAHGLEKKSLFIRFDEWVLDALIYLNISIMGPKWE